uniref:Glycine cleavage system t protein (Aminomethyltransferase) n=1 Tax=uncultured bacterium HF0070_11A08 TaxID=710812 RepID=E0XPH9_9BACT|nr:glycine cleavage system t protein (aminomethyltransferase) [uncultured bacterium HF0070_11A08]
MVNLQEEKDLDNNVLISARRFEESPFIARHDTSKMVRGVYAGRFQAVYAGEDHLEKYWLLRRKALIFDVPEKPIEISGRDAVPFLEKVLSRRISTMEEGRGYYALACTPSGGIFMDGVVFKLGTNRFWYVQADGPFETWLMALSVGFDVEIKDPKSRVLQIQGPASIAIMNAASGGAIDETMRYFRSGYFDLGGQSLYVSRTGFTNELGFEIYCDGEKTNHLALWDHLMASGEPHGMEFSSTRALTIRRIEGGILGNTTDMDASMTPFEAGLGAFVDLEKDDFIGRDALIDADRRSLLFGLTCSEATPSSGSEILDGQVVVGHITAGVPSPTLGLGIGYARFAEPGEWVCRAMALRLPDGSTHACDIVDLPFFDKEHKIVRGLDRTIP